MKQTGNRFDIRHKETLMLFLRNIFQIPKTDFSHRYVQIKAKAINGIAGVEKGPKRSVL